MFSLSDLIIAGVCLILSSTGVHIVWFDCQLVFILRCSLWVDRQLVFTLSKLMINWCSHCPSWSSTGVHFELIVNWCSFWVDHQLVFTLSVWLAASIHFCCLVWLAASIHFCCLVWLAASIHFCFAWFRNYCMEFICFWLLLDVTRVISCMAFCKTFTPDILLHHTEKPIQNLVQPD